MFTHTKQNQVGFTLIEILLYMSLAVVMVLLISEIGVRVMSTGLGVRADEDLQYNAIFVTETVRTLLSQADTVLVPIQGATSSVLSVGMADVAKDPTAISLVDGVLYLQEGTNPLQQLTGDAIFVSSLEFANLSSATTSASIRLEMDMGLRNPSNRVELTATTSITTAIQIFYYE